MSVICLEAVEVCAVLNMGNVRTSDDTSTRYLVTADLRTSSSRTTVRMNRSAIADSEPRRGAAAIVALTGTAQFRTIRRRPKTPPEDSTACRGRRQATDARSARLAAVPPNRAIVIIAERGGARYSNMGRRVPKSTPPRFEGPLNHGRFVHNAAPPYHTLFRPFRYHPGAARSPLKPVETASGC